VNKDYQDYHTWADIRHTIHSACRHLVFSVLRFTAFVPCTQLVISL